MATIRDVAARAGVSPSTASRALNGTGRIGAKTVQKVRKAAAELGYEANIGARNLALGEANVVGLVFPVSAPGQSAHPFHLDLIQGMNEALEARNYIITVAMGSSKDSVLNQVRSMVAQMQVRHFIVMYTEENDPITAYFRDNDINFIVIGHPTQNHPDRYVDTDNVWAGETATKFLIERRNVTDPIFVRSANRRTFEVSREQGYLKAAPGSGRIFEKSDIPGAVKELLAVERPGVGYIFADDMVLLEFMRSAMRGGALPGAPVICFNQSPMLDGLLGKDLSWVDILPRLLGSVAVRVLFERETHHHLVSFNIIP
ncbi:MAG: LacI family DNA-binding transcriptional regulator [Corynebacterium sp.]|nr:LacI family DNA-binding transcriptional regulator [Corynebacterium sp.]